MMSGPCGYSSPPRPSSCRGDPRWGVGQRMLGRPKSPGLRGAFLRTSLRGGRTRTPGSGWRPAPDQLEGGGGGRKSVRPRGMSSPVALAGAPREAWRQKKEAAPGAPKWCPPTPLHDLAGVKILGSGRVGGGKGGRQVGNPAVPPSRSEAKQRPCRGNDGR